MSPDLRQVQNNKPRDSVRLTSKYVTCSLRRRVGAQECEIEIKTNDMLAKYLRANTYFLLPSPFLLLLFVYFVCSFPTMNCVTRPLQGIFQRRVVRPGRGARPCRVRHVAGILARWTGVADTRRDRHYRRREHADRCDFHTAYERRVHPGW